MRRMYGLTVIELLVVTALIAIVLAIAIPGFGDLLARRRVEGVANELSADLQYTRSEAVSRQTNMEFATAADGTSYTIRVVAPANIIKTVTLPAGITATPSVVRSYEPLRGTAGGDSTIDIASTATAGRLRITSNFMGRVQMCSPSGSLGGYTSC